MEIGEIYFNDVDEASLKESEANADFIVKACNCHYKLLGACKTALADCEMALSGEWDKSDEGFEAIREMLQAVINKATGGDK
jgi:hypothetical protein